MAKVDASNGRRQPHFRKKLAKPRSWCRSILIQCRYQFGSAAAALQSVPPARQIHPSFMAGNCS